MWLEPIESKTQGPNDLSEKIDSFLQDDEGRKKSTRYISKMEKEMKQYIKKMPKTQAKSVVTYTQFYSMYEFRIIGKMMIGPDQIEKVDATNADQTSIHSASLEILSDLAHWISKHSN